MAMLLVLLSLWPLCALCYVPAWDVSAVGGAGVGVGVAPLHGDRQPTCVAIPANLTLCAGIRYTRMRMPNLLDHDSVSEVLQQASSWVPLLNIKCHADTQLFLCSLFAPVCLERPIYPCRSLCQKVKSGCEGTMKTYGFPWPSMLDCDKFPLDNDMCIASQAEKNQQQSSHPECDSRVCNQADTYENILDNFCQADFVVKMKLRRVKRTRLLGRSVDSVFKTWRGTPAELRQLRKPKLQLLAADACCAESLAAHDNTRQRYLVMGKKNDDGSLVAKFILPWSKSEELRRARRMFKQIDCSDLAATTQRMMAEALNARSLDLHDNLRLKKRRRRRRKNTS